MEQVELGTQDPELFQCIDCGEWKNRGDFFRNAMCKSGYRPECKPCSNIRQGKAPYRPERGRPAKNARHLTYPPPETPRFCKKCNTERQVKDFYKDASQKDGLKRACKDCTKVYYSKYPNVRADIMRKHAHKARAKKHGLTPEIIAKVMAFQEDVCAICGGVNPKQSLSLDMDPSYNKLRGLLCAKCKRRVRQLDDDPARVILITREVHNEAVAAFAQYVIRPPLWNTGILDEHQGQTSPPHKEGINPANATQGFRSQAGEAGSTGVG